MSDPTLIADSFWTWERRRHWSDDLGARNRESVHYVGSVRGLYYEVFRYEARGRWYIGRVTKSGDVEYWNPVLGWWPEPRWHTKTLRQAFDVAKTLIAMEVLKQ
jgi:hypothetical protein